MEKERVQREKIQMDALSAGWSAIGMKLGYAESKSVGQALETAVDFVLDRLMPRPGPVNQDLIILPQSSNAPDNAAHDVLASRSPSEAGSSSSRSSRRIPASDHSVSSQETTPPLTPPRSSRVDRKSVV